MGRLKILCTVIPSKAGVLKAPICVTGMVLPLVFCTVISIANGFSTFDCSVQRSFEMLWEAYSSVCNCAGIVRFTEQEHDRSWRDLQLHSVLPEKRQFCLIRGIGNKFTAVSAEFTICTANLLAVLVSFERLSYRQRPACGEANLILSKAS